MELRSVSHADTEGWKDQAPIEAGGLETHGLKLKDRPADLPFKIHESMHAVGDSVIVMIGGACMFKNAIVVKVHLGYGHQAYDVEVKWQHANFVPTANEEREFTARLYNVESMHVFRPQDFEQSHPEDYCQQCGGKNVVWSADNDLWNELINNREGIICPQCFQKLADAKGVSVIFRATPAKEAEQSTWPWFRKEVERIYNDSGIRPMALRGAGPGSPLAKS